MFVTSIVEAAVAAWLAAEGSPVAPAADALHVHLIKGAFAPGLGTSFGTLTPAAFTGSAAKSAGISDQTSYVDPLTGNRVVQLLEPAGGWHWQATVAPSPAEVIYGYCVTDNANAVTYGSELFPSPVTIGAIGDGLNIPEIQLILPPGFFSTSAES